LEFAILEITPSSPSQRLHHFTPFFYQTDHADCKVMSAEESVDNVEELLRKRVETMAAFGQLSKQKFKLSRLFGKYVDGAPDMDIESFSCAMVELNFVGCQQNIEALFNRYASPDGLLNIESTVNAILDQNLRQKRDAQKRAAGGAFS
jgi:hypothetical protein